MHLYCGLRGYVEKFAKERDYVVEYEFDNSDKQFSVVEAKQFCESLKLPFEVKDYQLKTFIKCVRQGRALCLSPTSSGKSLMIYLLYQYYSGKTLIICPTVNLVLQMASDFASYGMDSDDIHKIFSGEEKDSDKPLCISTWQSLHKLPKEYFDQYDVITVDEAHGAQATTLKGMMEKAVNCDHKFGWTGTLSGTTTHLLVLTGLFGRLIENITTADMITQGHASQLEIKCILLKHPEINCKLLKKAVYQDEIDFIISNGNRNKFIKNLALSLDGNTLILFRLVEKHGKVLYDEIQNSKETEQFGLSINFVHGEIEAEDREAIRKIIEGAKRSITVASYGTFSTGVNIPRIDNIIFSSPYKSRIKVLQSIGRGLRLAEGKSLCTVFDIADDLSYKKHQNHTLKHFAERVTLYAKENFNYKLYRVEL
jgi:superfamily II DNA or RNA helicase